MDALRQTRRGYERVLLERQAERLLGSLAHQHDHVGARLRQHVGHRHTHLAVDVVAAQTHCAVAQRGSQHREHAQEGEGDVGTRSRVEREEAGGQRLRVGGGERRVRRHEESEVREGKERLVGDGTGSEKRRGNGLLADDGREKSLRVASEGLDLGLGCGVQGVVQTVENVDRRDLLGERERVAGQRVALTQASENRFGNLRVKTGWEGYLVRVVLHLRELKRVVHIHQRFQTLNRTLPKRYRTARTTTRTQEQTACICPP